MKTSSLVLIITVTFCFSLCAVCAGKTITVNSAGGADFTSIQAAIADAGTVTGDEIQVAPGTYLESGVIDFLGKAVRLYSSDGAEVTIIDGNNQHRVVQCVNGEDPNTILEGFTITRGYADKGAGMYNENSSPTITHCIFTVNKTHDGVKGGDTHDGTDGGDGGGMYNFYSNPIVMDCTFSFNTTGKGGKGGDNTWANPSAGRAGRGGNGAGICNINSFPEFLRCIFKENTTGAGEVPGSGYHVDFSSDGGSGAGMYNLYSSVIVTDCDFIQNKTGNGGKSFHSSGGGNGGNGAGMQNVNSSSIITYCTFRENQTGNGETSSKADNVNLFPNHAGNGGNGAGISNKNSSSPQITDCTFIGNITGKGGIGLSGKDVLINIFIKSGFKGGDGGYGGGGAGICNIDDSNPVITNCIFRENQTGNGGHGGRGSDCIGTTKGGDGGDGYDGGSGAGICNLNSKPVVINCIFTLNKCGIAGQRGKPGSGSSQGHWGKSGLGGGGALSNNASEPILTNCTFSFNSSDYGGGVYNVRYSNPVITHCIFTQNLAHLEGGGVFNINSGGTFMNCLFKENSAYRNGGGMYNISSNPVLTNCTFVGNSTSYDGTGLYNQNSNPVVTNCILWDSETREIYNDSGSLPVIICSDIQGGYPGTGNINIDPLFADADGRLTLGSPCSGAGNNNVPNLPPNDLDGNPRINGSVIDMGVFERTEFPIRNVTQDRFYDKIQNAINDANNNDQIRVLPGTYMESIDFKGKAVLLYSAEGPEMTVLDGTGYSHVVRCVNGEGADTILEGFTIQGGNAAGSLVEDFSDGNYNGWTIVDQGNVYGPSAWSAAASVMSQSSNIASSPETKEMLGTYALWGYGADWEDYHVEGTLRSTDNDYLGIMFRYQDVNNYYRFSWGKDTRFHNCMLGKMKNGVFTVLNYDSTAYVPYTTYAFKVSAVGSSLQVYIDGQLTLSATDSDFDSGSIALYSWGNEGSEFDEINVEMVSEFNYCGGGMYNQSSSPTVTQCIFKNNSASRYGGAMYNADQSCPAVTNCIFTDNTAVNGGGMYNVNGCNPLISGCIFLENASSGLGGGISNIENSCPTMTLCSFKGNSAGYCGGGMFNQTSSPIVTNCIFNGNIAFQLSGGGMFNENSSPVVTNSTFNNNIAQNIGGGVGNISGSIPQFTNCIFWDDLPNEIFDDSSSSIITYSDVQGGWPGMGNINIDPLFTDAVMGDYRLYSSASPCVDTGSNSASGLLDMDMKDDPRVWDGNLDGGSVVDMGAFELYSRIKNKTSDRSYQYIQTAINDANNLSCIEVAAGTYYENINFLGKSIVLASTDPNDPEVVSETIIDGRFAGSVVTFNSHEDPNCVLAGFTLTHGQDRNAIMVGAGIHCYQSQPTIRNCNVYANVLPGAAIHCISAAPHINGCIISNNTCDRAAVVFENGSDALFQNCIVQGNLSSENGGIYCESSDPTITGCIVTENRVYDSYDILDGSAGISCRDSDAIIEDCTIALNSSGQLHYMNIAGGIYFNGGNPTVRRCSITDNYSSQSGGGIMGCAGLIEECQISGNVAFLGGGGLYMCPAAIVNCIISDNQAYEGAGLSWCGFVEGSGVDGGAIVNCSIINNMSGLSGGGLEGCGNIVNCTIIANRVLESGHAVGGGLNNCSGIANCIIWGNYALTADNQLSECSVPSYSCIQGWTGGGIGNIASDPNFRQPGQWTHDTDPNILVGPGDPNAVWTEGNYRLNPGSPCIDAGSNSAVPGSVTTDLNGWPRFIDDLCVADTASGTAPIVDMGAYEFLPADIDGSGTVNLWDWDIVAAHWLENGGDCQGADMNCDRTVDLNDVLILIEWWLAGS